MLARITTAQHAGDFRVRLTFSDGVSGEVDLRSDVVGAGGVFEPLQELDYFAKVSVDAEAGTIVWPNGVDLDPDVLYARITNRTSVPEQARRAV